MGDLTTPESKAQLINSYDSKRYIFRFLAQHRHLKWPTAKHLCPIWWPRWKRPQRAERHGRLTNQMKPWPVTPWPQTHWPSDTVPIHWFCKDEAEMEADTQIPNHALYNPLLLNFDIGWFRGCSESISEAVGDVARFLLVSPVCLIIGSLSRLAAMDSCTFLVSRLARWMQRLQSASEITDAFHTHNPSNNSHIWPAAKWAQVHKFDTIVRQSVNSSDSVVTQKALHRLYIQDASDRQHTRFDWQHLLYILTVCKSICFHGLEFKFWYLSYLYSRKTLSRFCQPEPMRGWPLLN